MQTQTESQDSITSASYMSLPTGRVVSVRVGMPQKTTAPNGRPWETAIFKEEVSGPVVLGRENLTGDYQANRKYHGGPDKAICFYASEHYPFWREKARPDMDCGAFGENLTVEGLTEGFVCVGDTLQVGTARLQIAQPRQPCANVSKRWSNTKVPALMQTTGYTGYYARVLETGTLEAGNTVTVMERPHPEWNLDRANRLMYDDTANPEEIAALRALPLLSAEWKRILGRKLAAL